MSNPAAASTPGIPALIVSGFLGSGKTSLVRHLLEEAQATGVRVAVVSNEFGALGIDQALLGDGEEGFVELEGGCVCCQLSDDLVNTLQALWEDVRPDRIIVETSGVALPYDTQLNFWREPVNAWIRDDMAIVVVNAEQVADGHELEGTFFDQVTSADLIVLNKVDLVTDEELSRAEQVLREMEPDAPIVRAEYGDVDEAVLFPPDLDGRRAERRRTQPEAPPHHHEHFNARELVIDHGITPAELTAQLEQLHALRAKGFVHTSEGLRLVQVVGRRMELTAVTAQPPDHLLGRVIVIHRSADPAAPQ